MSKDRSLMQAAVRESNGFDYSRWKAKKLEQDPPPALPPVDAEMLADPLTLFHHLTRWTVPHGFEHHYYGPMLDALGFAQDKHGNYYRQIFLPNGEDPTTCFMAHLDTASDEVTPIVRHYDDGIISTDGNSILGADDRAGVTVLLYLLGQGVPGLYYLFLGEEEGCVGSSALAHSATSRLDHIQRAISFDRRGDNSVITYQCGDRCCSDEFAEALSRALNEYGFNFKPDDNGVFTDSREFVWMISECTNISVGYDYQHSCREIQDITFLQDLCVACTMIDWEALPTVRDHYMEYLQHQDERDAWRQDNWKYGSVGYAESYREAVDYDSYTGGYGLVDNDITAYGLASEAIEKICRDFQNGYPVLPTDLDPLVTDSRELNLSILERLIDRLQESCY